MRPPSAAKRSASNNDDAETEPAKKVHRNQLSAVERQRQDLERLLKKAEKPVALPEIYHKKVRSPPEFVMNTHGSAAGASSSDFHIYRAYRRHETERIKHIEEEAKEEQKKTEFERKRLEAQAELDRETAKRRAKRQRRKQGQAKKDDNDKKTLAA
ncbi:hypothetical protein IWQ60_012050 [Tieghemiomyces parasiticus]|uniref:PRKR-interacting protein 1 n=1 Tax=Tieghemiomyces parasiticus TaxID=78921 RepID=A0A9W8DKZ4_9FUNG|nr:hypothetical protein IWQ60_012050 [Tieghemiomyces parasiticus]